MSTQENLQDAFAGESQANRKYLAYASKADTEGMPQVARLFRAAAEAETVHAHAHFRAMGALNDTKANLEDAVAGEHYECTEMYPPFLEEAREEGHQQAARSFEYALAVEKVHRELYKKAQAAVKDGQDMPATAIYVCPVCGYTVEGEAPDNCPVCRAARERFIEIE